MRAYQYFLLAHHVICLRILVYMKTGSIDGSLPSTVSAICCRLWNVSAPDTEVHPSKYKVCTLKEKRPEKFGKFLDKPCLFNNQVYNQH